MALGIGKSRWEEDNRLGYQRIDWIHPA